MSIAVTATQGGSVANGMALRVFVLTGTARTQNGATTNQQLTTATSFTQSITTTQAGSRVYGVSSVFANNSATAAALTTVTDNIADSTNNARYVTFKAASLTGTPGPTTLGFTVASSSGPFAQAEILSTGTLAEDASGPAAVLVTGATAATTANFAPPPGSLLIALVASHGGVSTETMTVTSGGNLTWTELVKNDPAGGDYAGVWIAQVPVRTSYTFASGRIMWSPGAPAYSPPLTILTTVLPNGTIGIAYNGQLTATGGFTPYTWSISSGSLPGWASLNTSTGAITGTPSGAPATTSFTVEVTDNNGNFTTQALSITTANVALIPPMGIPVKAKLPVSFYRSGVCGDSSGLNNLNNGSISGPAARGWGTGTSGGPVVNPNVVTAIGSYVTVSGTASPVTGVWHGTQNIQPGDTLVAVVGYTGSTHAGVSPWTAQNAGTTGWIKLVEEISSATPLALAAIWYKPAAGEDAAPAFTSSATGTITSSITLYVLRNVDPDRIPDTAGIVAASAATISAQTVTTAGAVRYSGDFAIAGFARERATVVSTITMTAPFILDTSSNQGVTSTGHYAAAHQAAPAAGARLSAVVNYSGTATTAAGAGVIAVFTANQGLGSVFYLANSPIQARIPARFRLAGQVQWNAGGPVKNPVPVIAFYSVTQAIRAKYLRLPIAGTITGSGVGGAICGTINGAGFGSGNGSRGAPVQNPQSGPAFKQRTTPVRFIIPPLAPRAGRIGTSFTLQVQIPVHGPPVYPLQGPVRARLPQEPVLRGRSVGNAGAPVRNPAAGPVFAQKTFPAKARNPLPARGRIYASALPVKAAPPHPAPLYPLTSPVRAKLPLQPLLRGRMAALWGAPVQNPQSGPVFAQATSPSRIRASLPPRGRIASNKGTAAHITPAAPFISRTFPARARFPLLLRGRVISNKGTVRNPQSGPVFAQKTSPVRVHPVLPPRGRISFNQGVVSNPVTGSGPLFTPKTFIRAQLPLSRRGISRAIKFYPPVSNPQSGPVFTQRTSPVQARFPLPPKGRISSNPGTVTAAVPQRQFPSRTTPARSRIILPPRGRIGFNKGIVRNPQSGPVFTQKTFPVRVHPVLPPRGRIAFNRGAVSNPVVSQGPVFIPRGLIRAQLPLPRRGICRAIKFYPVQTQPVPPNTPAPLYPLQKPVRAPIPQLQPRAGRIGSNPGVVSNPSSGPAIVSMGQPAGIRVIYVATGRSQGTRAYVPPVNPHPGPVFQQATSPIRIRITLPPRGRIASIRGTFGNPVISSGPVFTQKPFPVQARIPQNAPRGRITFNKGSTVRNPQSGPAFIQAVRPAQVRIPQVFSKGRVYSNPGGPLSNPPEQLAPLYPLQRPVQAKFPLPRRGRIASNPGTLPPPPERPAPLYPLAGPVRIRVTLPPRGRISSNKGAPLGNPVQAKVYPLEGPVKARQPLPPKGRVVLGNKGAPVHNPAPGPVFRQAVHPIRAIIPQNAPRGRTNSNPGGPVSNPSGDRAAVWNSGQTYTRWTAGSPYGRWQLGQPYTRESTGEG